MAFTGVSTQQKVTWMRSLSERIDMARRHTAAGLIIIERQRAVIDRRRNLGEDVSSAEELLARFEQSQTIFEDDLDRLLRDKNKQ